jgi:hypothetical protein
MLWDYNTMKYAILLSLLIGCTTPYPKNDYRIEKVEHITLENNSEMFIFHSHIDNTPKINKIARKYVSDYCLTFAKRPFILNVFDTNYQEIIYVFICVDYKDL